MNNSHPLELENLYFKITELLTLYSKNSFQEICEENPYKLLARYEFLPGECVILVTGGEAKEGVYYPFIYCPNISLAIDFYLISLRKYLKSHSSYNSIIWLKTPRIEKSIILRDVTCAEIENVVYSTEPDKSNKFLEKELIKEKEITEKLYQKQLSFDIYSRFLLFNKE